MFENRLAFIFVYSSFPCRLPCGGCIFSKTDEILASPTFNVTETDLSWIETEDGAMLKALDRLSYYVNRYCNRWLSLRANVLEGARDKKDKQKEVYIDLGNAEGAYKGLHMGVYTVKTVAGKEAKKQIGKLKIEEVQGDGISLCKQLFSWASINFNSASSMASFGISKPTFFASAIGRE